MASINPIDLIADHKAGRRFAAALQAKQQQVTEANRAEIAGTVIGGNADRGTVLIEPENGGGTIEAEYISNGYLAQGSRVLVTMNGSKAWVGGMPQ